ncbi:IS110 family RNA-guided transposase [Amedibacillus sp. YH-ame6]
MKIVRPICCGMDVHKNLIVATIGITDLDSRITKYIQEDFSTLNFDLLRLKNWLKSYDCFDVCMESTGKYWIPIFNILEDEINVFLTHPKYVKAIKGKKTDKKDSKWICDLFKHDLIKFSFIPPKEIRALREICRYRYKLICMRSSERNRYQNCMTVSNVGLASVVSDPFGKTATAIMQEVLSSDVINDAKILKLIHGSCKNKDKILDSLLGSKIETDQRFKMTESMHHMEELSAHILSCELEMVKRVLPMMDQCTQIAKLKGFGMLSAIVVISEIGIDMHQFESDKQLACWAGLAPANNESAKKKKSVRISKAGQYLKPLLVQCALAATKDKESYFGLKYSRIKNVVVIRKQLLQLLECCLFQFTTCY